MAKATTRSRGKKKLQDVIESIPDGDDSAVAESSTRTRKKRKKSNGSSAKEASSRFVENEQDGGANEGTDVSEAKSTTDDAKPKARKKKGDYDDSSPIDKETHEKYERVKRGELHITDLQKMTVAELHDVAKDEEIEDYVGLPKQDLIFQILKQRISQNGLLYGEGVLEVLPDGFGFLRSPEYNYLPCPDDIYVSPSQIRRFGLRNGHVVAGSDPPAEGERAVLRAAAGRGDQLRDAGTVTEKTNFEDLTPLHPRSGFPGDRSERANMRIVDW
jgi:transcription termination factor Rho